MPWANWRLEVAAGSPDADALSAEALALGQDLAMHEAALARLFTTRGLCHAYAGRRPQAAAHLREAARLAGQAGDSVRLGIALLNLSDAVTGTDPAVGAEAARAAHDLADTATTRDLLALLDDYPPGRLAPVQRAERDLARARLAAAAGDPDAGPALAAAVTGLRQHSTPYHLAHGLLDHAGHLAARSDAEAAGAAISEAAGVAARLGCQPLLDRAETTRPARPRTAAS